MKSSFLCVIVIGFLFQVFALDQLNFQLWPKNAQKINEEQKYQLWRERIHKINEDTKKRKEYELAIYMASKAFEDGDQPPRIRTQNPNAYLICAEMTGVSPDTILSIKEGDWTDDDRKAKDWVKCVLMKNELMTDQSVFRLDVAFKYLTELERPAFEENIDMCLPYKAMPPVELSWEFAKCFQTADPTNSMF